MEPKRKILLGITKANWGGAQRYVFDLASALSETHEIKVMGGEPGDLGTKLNGAHIPFIELPRLGRDIRWLGELQHLFDIYRAIRREKPDVLHLNSPKMAGLGALAGRLCGVPHIVVTVHGWYFLEPRNILARILIFFFSWLTAVLAHITILITKGDYRTAQRFPLIPASKFTYIPNGINNSLPLFSQKESREIIKRRVAIRDTDDVWVGSITELIPNKDPGTAVKAIAETKRPIPFYIIGSGKEEALLKALIQSLALQGRVHLLGFIPEASRLLSAFDIFVFSSVKEGLPYVLLEAGLAGLPVIATSVGGIPDIIEHGKTGILIPPQSPAMLRNALLQLIEDEALRKSLGANLRRKVLREFPLEAMVTKTTELYEAQMLPKARIEL